MVSEKERKNRHKLFQLMQEHPDLPVVAMVNSEIVADDGYCYWQGVFGKVSIGEFVKGNENIHFREDDDSYEVDSTLYDCLSETSGGLVRYRNLKTDEDMLKAYGKLRWIKAIIVCIEVPDE